MRLFYIKNLRGKDVAEVDPFKDSIPDAPEYKKDKFRRWSLDPSTDHFWVSSVEGLNPHARVDKENPPAKVHGFFVDYDAVAGDDPMARIKKKGGAPTYFSITPSGQVRLYWAFPEPLPVNEVVCDSFLEACHAAVKAPKLFPGYDETSARAVQYFAIGTAWEKVGPEFDLAAAQAALFRAWTKVGRKSVDVDVPLDKVAAEVAKRWPGRWKGKFELEARGPLFWIDDGIDRDGCVVKPDGIVVYSDRAGTPYLSWRELLGNSFVAEFETTRIADSIANIYYDGKNYYRTDEGYGLIESKEDVSLILRSYGFSPKAKKGAALSEVEQAMLHIQRVNRVDGAAPVIFDPNTLVIEPSGRKLVNLSRIKPTYPATEGDPSTWPWLHGFFEQWLDNTPDVHGIEARQYFFAWLSRIILASVDKVPLQGQALILAGPAGRGKTLFGRKILGGACGGFAEAGAYLTGKTHFNRELSMMPIWTVDDGESAVDYKDQRRFTELLKRAVANPTVSAEAKGIDAQTVPWTGRVVLGANMDAHSLSVIPNLDQSNRDKIMAFRISDDAPTKFPANTTLEKIITRELPHFVRWVLDYVPDDERVMGNSRFGVNSYFHPQVEEAARANSPRHQTLELIEIFVKEWRVGAGRKEWKGTGSELVGAMADMPGLRAFPQLKSPMMFQRDLQSAEEYSKEHKDLRPIKSERIGTTTLWTIDCSPKFDGVEAE